MDVGVFETNGCIWGIKKCLDGSILWTVYNLYKNNHIVKYKYDKENLTTIFEKRRAQNNPIYDCIELSNWLLASGEGGQKLILLKLKYRKFKKKLNK